MLNLTLTITAAPELLAAMTDFTSAITAAKVVAIPEYNSDFINHKPLKEQNPSIQQAIQAEAAAVVTPVPTSTVPTSTQTYTMEQLAVAATQLVDAGRRSELVNLLQTFGVQALTALPKEQYGAFATQLRALGAKIDNLCVKQANTGGAKI